MEMKVEITEEDQKGILRLLLFKKRHKLAFGGGLDAEDYRVANKFRIAEFGDG